MGGPASKASLARLCRLLLLVGAAGALSALADTVPPWQLEPVGRQPGDERWTGPWRWRDGDNPAWANPDFDDSAWKAGSSATVPLEWSDRTWSGRGWFRARLDTRRLAHATQLALSLNQAGASEVYLDGRQVFALGGFNDPGPGGAVLRTVTPAIITLEPDRHYLLAVRYDNSQAPALNRVLPEAGGFVVQLATPDRWFNEALAWTTETRGLMMFFTAVPILLAVLHFALFVFLPRSTESLYCALFMAALSLLSYTRLDRELANSVAGFLAVQRLFLIAIVAFSLFGLLTLYATFNRRLNTFFYVLLAGGVGLIAWILLAVDDVVFRSCAAFGFVSSIDVVRVSYLAVRARLDGARLVFSGMVIFGLSVIYNALRIFEVVPEWSFSTHTINLGVLAAALAMSLFISRNYALTSRRLEQKLHEVEELSASELRHEAEKRALIVAQNERLEQEVRERTQELSTEKGKSDQLLANILPAEIAAELKEHGASAPRRFEEVTILFSDFKGFTHTTAAMPAHKIVAELDDLFRSFDDIMAQAGVEKIKTIGDAYMAAAGLPEARVDHANRALRAAFAMIACLRARNESAAVKWNIRIGLHSGPVVAGVVGKRKFTFDVFGDTVNIASRMESMSEPGRVNVSAYTYDLLRATCAGDYRGKIEVKGKGELDMYLMREPGQAGA